MSISYIVRLSTSTISFLLFFFCALVGVLYYLGIVKLYSTTAVYRNSTSVIILFFVILLIVFYNMWIHVFINPIIIKYSQLCIFWTTSTLISIFLPMDICTLPFILMLLVCICSVYYCIQFTVDNLFKFYIYIGAIIISGYVFLTTKLILLFFIAYEMLLIPTCIMLFLFTKTTRGKTAVRSMILWTQSGALFLFLILYISSNFQLLSTIDSLVFINNRVFLNIFILVLFFCFGTKIPVWPFFWWLPEAHVEISTHFSIVLSGVSIKFAFLGLWRFLNIYGAGDVYWLCICLCLFGLFSALLQVDIEVDLKKIVALLTVVEMHIFCIFLFIDTALFTDFLALAVATHCWVSSLQFILVDIISRRYYSRNLEHLYGIMSGSPLLVKLIFVIIFIFGSIPGTNVFMIELCMQIYASLIFCGFVLVFCLQFLSVVWSKQTWWLLWGGDLHQSAATNSFNLTKQELYFILVLVGLLLAPFSLADLWLL